jgi:hypothetical protein
LVSPFALLALLSQQGARCGFDRGLACGCCGMLALSLPFLALLSQQGARCGSDRVGCCCCCVPALLALLALLSQQGAGCGFGQGVSYCVSALLALLALLSQQGARCGFDRGLACGCCGVLALSLPSWHPCSCSRELGVALIGLAAVAAACRPF